MRYFRAGMNWKRFENLRLQNKMIVTFLLFGFFPMLLSSLIVQNSAMENIKREAEHSGMKGVEQLAERVDEHMRIYNAIADTVVLDGRLIQMLNRQYDNLNDAIDLYHYIWKLRDFIMRENPDIGSVTLYTDQPTLISASPYLIHLDDYGEFSDYGKLQIAKYTPWLVAEKDLLATDTAPAARKDEYAISINRLITRPNSLSQPIGVASLVVDEEALNSLIQNNVGFSATMIVDGEDMVVSTIWNDLTPVSELVGHPVCEFIPEETWEAGRDVRYRDVDWGEMSLIRRDLRWGWKVVSVISVDGIQESARTTQRRGLWVIGFSAVLAVILVFIVNARTTRRIQRLLNKFSVAKGARLLPGVPVGGKDEIGELDEQFMNMANQLNSAIHDLYTVELQKKESILKALQARINPHFLYNTLSDIAWMTQTNPPGDVRRAIEMLADYYRTCLSGGRDRVTLREELDGVIAYLNIQKMRMGRRIQTTILTDPMLDEVSIPKQTLQPIVENSIDHGLTGQRPGVSICITSAVEGNQALIYVTDDGPGFQQETLEQLREGSLSSANGGYGIQNVQMRLRLSFGKNYGLSFENLPGHGARTTIRIPLGEE